MEAAERIASILRKSLVLPGLIPNQFTQVRLMQLSDGILRLQAFDQLYGYWETVAAYRSVEGFIQAAPELETWLTSPAPASGLLFQRMLYPATTNSSSSTENHDGASRT